MPTWVLTLLVGGLGGALNAAIAGDLPLWPTFMVANQRPRVVRIGLLGNVAVGAIVAVGVVSALRAGACQGVNANWPSRLAGLTAWFIGFAAARWVTNEMDKWLLRRAVCKASAAPAAHPDVVRTMETAGAYAIYTTADALMPRFTGHR